MRLRKRLIPSRLNLPYDSGMIVLIDNYDSFTYNLVQYLGEMGQQVEVRRTRDEMDVLLERLDHMTERLRTHVVASAEEAVHQR